MSWRTRTQRMIRKKENGMKKKEASDYVLFDSGQYRVCRISKFDMPTKKDESGRLIFDGDCIHICPVSYGLGIESKLIGGDGSPYYYVVAFVHYDKSKDGEVSYDTLLDRVAEEWVKHPDTGEEFRKCLEFAEDAVKEANEK